MLSLKERLLAMLSYDPYAGEGKRFKYRIRYYGNDAEQLWLEKKEKYNSCCHKRKCALTTEEYQWPCEGCFLE